MIRNDKEIQDKADIESILDEVLIMRHYSDQVSFEYPDNALNSIAVIKVAISSMTGKRSPADLQLDNTLYKLLIE
ncbi:MAG TPA: hypothetical protein DF296_01335 [Candidatus Margulisbacteria bacterium]|nr:MAG: hypothetical protein A2X42_10510 [Candidatus Margulisbacteria bacterium GWF2_38_17]OGI05675.1 MAG: hypothetical protein A2X41_03095 [Candidatus Margulisbacteria bacterium GWE2_39_32]HCT83826.1 hypothetical protein [Candidatus Margulisiibacteriota bacterium]